MAGLGSALDTVNRLGWLNGLLYLASRALSALSGGRCRIIKYYFVAQPVPAPAPVAASRPSAIALSRIAADHPLVQSFPRPKDVISRRFADGAICYCAVKNEALIGFIWLRLDEYMEDEVRCLYKLVPVGSAGWDFDVYVEPAHRLSRAFARLWDAANGFLREQGRSWSISRISAFNPGSLAAHERLGARRFASGTFLTVGPAQLSLLTCPPYVHFALSQGAYPILHLQVPSAAEAACVDGAPDVPRPLA